MPVFTFKCLTCGKEEDRLVKASDVDKMQFCSCRKELSMRKIDSFGVPALNFKGNWYKTTGNY